MPDYAASARITESGCSNIVRFAYNFPKRVSQP